MNPLGLVMTGPSVAPLEAPVPVKLQIHNILASAQRLWLRGKLEGLPNTSGKNGVWWPLRKKNGDAAAPLLARVETQVSGQTLAADVPVEADGTWEATFEVKLPPARRGWRVARTQVTVLDQKVEACSLVGEPPEAAAGVVIVVLPLHLPGQSGWDLAPCAQQMGSTLQSLCAGARGGHAIYYLARVPATQENAAAELGLALTALGWPTGHLLLLEGNCLVAALDRLRWLFAGQFDLQLFNLDPAVTLDQALTTAADRADVRLTQLLSQANGNQSARGFAPSRKGLRPSRSSLLTRYPLVFCHGMLACTLLRMQLSRCCNYFAVLDDFLRERGFRALFPQVLPTGGVVERAEQLREQILSWTEEPVNLIAHSMGGLDCRYLITHLGMADRVKSLTTISTPHRGTYIADWFQANYRRRVPLLLTLEALGVNVDGFRDCQLAACRDFNARTPDAAGVRYFSYGGEVPQHRVTPMLRRGWALLIGTEGPNDGLVSVASASWGEYLGTICADHFAQTPDGLFCHPRETFDALGFFGRLVEDLARRGL